VIQPDLALRLRQLQLGDMNVVLRPFVVRPAEYPGGAKEIRAMQTAFGRIQTHLRNRHRLPQPRVRLRAGDLAALVVRSKREQLRLRLLQ